MNEESCKPCINQESRKQLQSNIRASKPPRNETFTSYPGPDTAARNPSHNLSSGAGDSAANQLRIQFRSRFTNQLRAGIFKISIHSGG